MQQFIDYVTEWWDYIVENMGLYIFKLVQIIVILVLCKVILTLISSYTKKHIELNNKKKLDSKIKRSNTLLTLTRSVFRYSVYFIGAMFILDILGFGNALSSLVLTAGVGSLAIGFGAQSLVKDVVTGFFLMFENQFAVGDYIKVSSAEGTVEAIAMRVTYLRTREGSQVIVPNGQISIVENISRGDSTAKVVISTSYNEDTEAITNILKTVVADYYENNKKLLIGVPSVLAITNFSNYSVDITIAGKTKNLKHWEVERGLRLAIKKEFDRLKIQFPYQTFTITEEKENKRQRNNSNKK